MAGRLDPPHDRVTLSIDELRVLEALEAAFAIEEPGTDGRQPSPARPRPPRRRWRGLGR